MQRLFWVIIMAKFFKNYGLSIMLASLFLLSWLGQLIFQLEEFNSQQIIHNRPVNISDFIPEFLSATFENWQSEFLQLLTFVVLATYFIHKDSPQSRDGDDKMMAQLSRIEKKLDMKRR